MKTRFIELDNIINLDKAKLLVVGARPSIEKSKFALNIASDIALKQKLPVLIFSLDMSKELIIKRISKISYMLGEPISEKKEKMIYIDDTPAISIEAICEKARKMKKEKDIRFIVIDYLQLIFGKEKTNIPFILKELAKELNIPILLISQLSKNISKNGIYRPTIQDFNKSKTIVQEADVVMLLYRDEIYNEDSEFKNIIEVIISKNTYGKTEDVKLINPKKYYKLVSMIICNEEKGEEK